MKTIKLLLTTILILVLLTGIATATPETPGALISSKNAEQVPGTTDEWEVTVSLNGLDLITTSDVVLVIDKSGSMGSNNKLPNTKIAAKAFVDGVLKDSDANTRIAIVTFNDATQTLIGFTNDKDALKTAINSISSSGGTNIQAGLHRADELLETSTANNKYVVLLGDGEPTYSQSVLTCSNVTISSCTRSGFVGSYTYSPTFVIGYDNVFTYNYSKRVGDGSNYATTLNHEADVYCPTHQMTHKYRTANNGIATIDEASKIKADGTEIYTVALGAGVNGSSVLRAVATASDRCYVMNSDDSTGLTSAFVQIAGKISYAATNAKVNDPMGQYFTVKDGASGISITQGTIDFDELTQTVVWNVGTIANATSPATMKYIVKLSADVPTNVLLETNGITTVEYLDVNGQAQEINFDVPKVNSGVGSIRMYSYLLDAAGNPLTAQGEIATDKSEIDFGDATYYEVSGNTALNYGGYCITAPPVMMFGSQRAVFVAGTPDNFGDESPSTVVLTAENPAAALYFAYIPQNTYSVSYFTAEDGVTGMPINWYNVIEGTVINEPHTPTKDGYTFDGWVCDKTFTFGDAISEDLTFEAKFTEIVDEPEPVFGNIRIYRFIVDADGNPLKSDGTIATSRDELDTSNMVYYQNNRELTPGQYKIWVTETLTLYGKECKLIAGNEINFADSNKVVVDVNENNLFPTTFFAYAPVEIPNDDDGGDDDPEDEFNDNEKSNNGGKSYGKARVVPNTSSGSKPVIPEIPKVVEETPVEEEEKEGINPLIYILFLLAILIGSYVVVKSFKKEEE